MKGGEPMENTDLHEGWPYDHPLTGWDISIYDHLRMHLLAVLGIPPQDLWFSHSIMDELDRIREKEEKRGRI